MSKTLSICKKAVDNGGYYFQECEYECDQAKARKLEEVVADLKQIAKELD